MEKELLNSLDVRLTTIIREWVKKNYGEAEADNPSWDIHALAEEICKEKYTIHTYVQKEYDMEDIDDVASAQEITLNDEQRELAYYRYKKLESSNLDLLYDIVSEVNEGK